MKSRLGATPFEVRNPNGTLRDLQGRTQLLETVRLDALRLFHPSVSFHTALTASNVVSSQSAKDTAFRLYRAYLQNTGSAAGVGYDLRLGRQWVLAGVGTGVVDGVSLGLSRNRWGGLDGFVGTLGADRMTRTRTVWGLDKPSRSLAFGGRLRFDRELGRIAPSLAVSFAQAERTPHQERVTDAQRVGERPHTWAPLR